MFSMYFFINYSKNEGSLEYIKVVLNNYVHSFCISVNKEPSVVIQIQIRGEQTSRIEVFCNVCVKTVKISDKAKHTQTES